MAAKVRETRADIGLALDGDADRLIVVDEKGTVLDGDQIMALCAQDLMQQGKLPGNILVATVMSNMALEVFMKERGGTLIRTNVGDRHVVAAMRQQGALLGGEQSGHLIFREYSTTGDGLLAALQILRIMRQRGRPLSELAGLLVPYPQELRNEGRGRVLLRYSGTEPLCRVMVEGQDADKVRVYANELAGIVEKALG